MTTKTNSSSAKFLGLNALWIAGISAFAAVLVHSYLLIEHFNLKFGQMTGQSLCNISETFNCAAVAASKYSEFLSVPVALWGAAFNLALVLLIAWYPMTEEAKRPATGRVILGLSGIIALASIVMGVISSLALRLYCPFCIGAYVLSFITFAAAWMGIPRAAASPLGESSTPASAYTPFLILFGLTVFGALVANDQIKKSYGGLNMGPQIRAQLNEWASNPQVQIDPVEPLVKGASPENAKMTIVEFADFRCIHCKFASSSLKAFINAHPDVRLVFQSWPLDGECNTSIKQANGASCLLSRAVYCAEKQAGRGWAAHDYVFNTQENYPSLEAVRSSLPQIAAAAGVPAADLEACAQSPETKAVIEKQAAVGTALKIGGTPTVYVNGKHLPGGQSVPVLLEAYEKLKTQ